MKISLCPLNDRSVLGPIFLGDFRRFFIKKSPSRVPPKDRSENRPTSGGKVFKKWCFFRKTFVARRKSSRNLSEIEIFFTCNNFCQLVLNCAPMKLCRYSSKICSRNDRNRHWPKMWTSRIQSNDWRGGQWRRSVCFYCCQDLICFPSVL